MILRSIKGLPINICRVFLTYATLHLLKEPKVAHVRQTHIYKSIWLLIDKQGQLFTKL